MATENPKEEQVQPVPILKVENYQEKLMCDFGHKFHSNSVELHAFHNTSGASLGELMYIDTERKVRMSLDSAPASGFFVACPVCHIIHVEGFAVIDPNASVLETADNQVPERRIELGL